MSFRFKKRCATCDDDTDDSIHILMKRPKMALYLDDNTPIRTIKVLDIGDNISGEFIRGYFEFASGMGQVTDVTFAGHDSEGNEVPRVAYVSFLRPEDAAMLLCYQNLQFSVEQADTVYQPKLDPTVLKIEDINDHCLLHIASYLHPMDLVNFSRTCKRLKSMDVHMFRKYSHIWSGPYGLVFIEKENSPVLLKEMGGWVRSLEWTNITQGYLQYISKYCRNVKELKLRNPVLHYGEIKQKKYFKHIESLEIDDEDPMMDEYWVLVDDCVTAMVTLSNVKTLKFRSCASLQGTFFNQWNDCQLKCLEIYNSSAVRNRFLNACNIGQFNTLIQLSLDCNELDAEQIALLQSLKNVRSLTLKRIDNQLAELVYSSLHQYLPKLTTLKISTENERVDLKSILNTISALPDLRHFSHSLMDWKLLHMIRAVRERGKQPRIEIEISEQLFNDPKKMEFAAAAKHVIKLTLDQCVIDTRRLELRPVYF